MAAVAVYYRIASIVQKGGEGHGGLIHVMHFFHPSSQGGSNSDRK
jgi:hypothetical protein